MPAPEPPSLDSLHSMTKSPSSHGDGDHSNLLNNHNPASPRLHTASPSHRNTSANGTSCSAGVPNRLNTTAGALNRLSTGAPNRNNGTSAPVIVNADGYAVVTKGGFSPSETALPQIPQMSSMSTSGGHNSNTNEDNSVDVNINGFTLRTDYDDVKDSVAESENDPNYESVDEALSKVNRYSGTGLKKNVQNSNGKTSSNIGVSPVGVYASVGGSIAHRGRTAGLLQTASPSQIRNETANHEYEEVSPPVSPLISPSLQASRNVIQNRNVNNVSENVRNNQDFRQRRKESDMQNQHSPKNGSHSNPSSPRNYQNSSAMSSSPLSSNGAASLHGLSSNSSMTGNNISVIGVTSFRSNQTSSSNGLSSSGISPHGSSALGISVNGRVPEQIDSAAAEVRDRVLEGHMYEEVSEVKKRGRESPHVKGKSNQFSEHSTKL